MHVLLKRSTDNGMCPWRPALDRNSNQSNRYKNRHFHILDVYRNIHQLKSGIYVPSRQHTSSEIGFRLDRDSLEIPDFVSKPCIESFLVFLVCNMDEICPVQLTIVFVFLKRPPFPGQFQANVLIAHCHFPVTRWTSFYKPFFIHFANEI